MVSLPLLLSEPVSWSVKWSWAGLARVPQTFLVKKKHQLLSPITSPWHRQVWAVACKAVCTITFQEICFSWEVLETLLLKALPPLRTVILGVKFQTKVPPLKSEV